MAKLRIGVLYEFWWDDDEERTGAEARPKRQAPDEDVQAVYDTLKKIGHNPVFLRLDGSRASLGELADSETDLIFNMAESYGGDDTLDYNIAAYLELLGRRYTGTGSRGLYLAQDKALAKKIFAFHDIRTPYFATSYRGKLDHAHDISFPLIVKPTSEDGSIGIDSTSVVGSVKELMEKIHYIHEEFDGPALIEEYIEGREIYAAVLGNDNAEALPLVELDLSRLPEGTPRIAGTEVKWEKETHAYKVTKSAPVEDMDEETTKRLCDTALAAYQALKLRDYGRIDMRLTEKGEVYVIEANPNPWLASSSEFAMAAKKSGRNYTQLIGEIVDLARARYAE
jgi:D-alanine-D-alanine ligase